MTTVTHLQASAPVHDQLEHQPDVRAAARGQLHRANRHLERRTTPLSPSLSFSNLIQYDNRSRNLGWQSRVRWTLQPGNDLFFAFNQGWIQEEGEGDRYRFRTQDTKISTKFQVLDPVLAHPSKGSPAHAKGCAFRYRRRPGARTNIRRGLAAPFRPRLPPSPP